MKKISKKIIVWITSIIFIFMSLNLPENQVQSAIKQTSSKAKQFRFYDAQSKKWYRTKINPKVKKHNYNWSYLVNKNKKIKYKDNNYTIRKGIDVSRHNGKINWKKVKKAGIDFAFIRIGYRGYGRNGGLYVDKQFRRNLKNARKAGIDVGVYFFSQAINKKEALEEANLVIKTLKGNKLDLPVVYDPERIVNAWARTDGVSGKQFTKNTIAFCNKIKKAGYKTMIYSNMYWEAFRFDLEKLSNYPIWYADYKKKPQTPYYFSFWQYSANGKVSGISGKVDLNIQFIPK